jgi:eukaryotic-like serine/threonine-protein kinase
MNPKTVSHLRRLMDESVFTHDRYRLLNEIGRGGMGIVYRAEDAELQREVALKVLSIDHEDAAVRMSRESRILAKLEHPGIVPIHDAGTLADGRPFYVMKLVRGVRLDQYQRAAHAIPERLRCFERLCEPVAFAHAHGIVHRDLKPENVMVGEFGEVLVLDWGVAKVAGENEPATVVGTRAYMAPEQALPDADQVDARADVYGLGRILRFLLDGGRLPRPLASVCEKATAPEAANRYATALDLSADVRRFLNGLPVSAHRESIWEVAWRLLRKYQAWVVLVLAYLLMRAIVFLWVRR